MRDDIHPEQISLFDPIKNRGVFERERERERERVNVVPRHIYHHIISVENLLAAWREFLRGKRRRKDVEKFSINLMDNILALHTELTDKSYKHGGYFAFKINDPKPRDIHKASVRDRLLHHAIYRVLYPYFDRKFIFDSFSCRRDKGTHRAINRFRKYGRIVSHNDTRTAWVLKCDVKKFFASIDHRILIKILGQCVKGRDIIWLLGQVIDSYHEKNKPGLGLPLGNLTSQLFVNIYMNKFDQYLKRELKVRYCIRYADDIVIFNGKRAYLDNLLSKISAFLKNELALSLHPDKVFIKTLASGIDFLGWVNFPHHRILRTSTKKRMIRKLKHKTSSNILASYSGLLGHGDTHELKKKLGFLEKKSYN